MPAPMIDGISGFKYKETIDKLIELEKKPIYRMQNEQIELSKQIEALRGLKERTKKLQESLKVLYNHDAAFEKKLVTSNPPGFIEGVANKNAETGTHSLSVKNLATSLKVKSDNIKTKENLPAGKITINETTKKFNGGSVYALKDFFNENFSKTLKAKVVDINSEESVLVLEGKETGKKGVWQVTDHDNLLDKLGIYRPRPEAAPEVQPEVPQAEAQPEMREERVPILFKPEFLYVTKEGPSEISVDKKSLTLSDNAARKYAERPGPIKDGNLKKLKMRVKYYSKPGKEEDTGPFSIQEGPVESLNIQGILLESYNITREREAPQFEEKVYDYGVKLNYSNNNVQKLSLKGRGELVEIPVSNEVVSCEFYVQDAQADFSNLEWIYEVKGPPKKDETDPKKDETEAKKNNADPKLTGGNQNFPNIIEPAQNALVNLDGVDLERDKNDDLKDILPNSTLRLLKASEETIKTEIQPNTEKAMEQVIDFVKSYNDLIAYTKKETQVAKDKETGKFRESQSDTGTLIANSSVRSLVNNLRIKALSAYPAQRDPQIKILPILGISTGKIGTSWGKERRPEGYLEVDEEKLKEMLLNFPTAVKEFFALDTNGDTKLDTGMAYTVERFLVPYTQFQGVIDSQITNDQEKISGLNDDILKVEEHVKKEEQKLREQFGRADSLMKQQKSTSEFIKNRMGK